MCTKQVKDDGTAVRKVYKLVMNHYERTSARGAWKPSDTETLYVTEAWYETLVSENELRFWRSLGTCSKSERYGITYVTRTSPDKLSKTQETYEPISMCNAAHTAGYREMQALIESADMRTIPCTECTNKHVVLRFGTDSHASYDLVSHRWVG